MPRRDAGPRCFLNSAPINAEIVEEGRGSICHGNACGYAWLKCVSKASLVESQRRLASSAMLLVAPAMWS